MDEEFHNYLNHIRRDFSGKPLSENDVPNNPFDLFQLWFDEAVGSRVLDPNAMSIATSNKGIPTSRIVYLRGINENGLLFYTNYNSSKGKEIKQNPKVAVVFYWAELNRQIRFLGNCTKTSAQVSDDYFAERPRESQLGAWASQQSEILSCREELEHRLAEYKTKFKGIEVPRPPYWGGYQIAPEKVEFFQGRPNRLHDRLLYVKSEDSWNIKRLNP